MGAFGHKIASKQHRKTSARALQVHDVVGDACGGGTVGDEDDGLLSGKAGVDVVEKAFLGLDIEG